MQTIKVRQVKLFVLVATLILIAVIVHRQMTKHAEEMRTVELVHAKAFNKSLAKLSVNILSPNVDFMPKFVNQRAEDVQVMQPKIPRIIHQFWDTHLVPKTFHKWIRSWKNLHPNWEHWLWTLTDVRNFVAKHYPDHLVLYDSYQSTIFRADVMRYFVLHHFGGVYADLDMEALLPLDNWTLHYECLVSEECYEHTFVVREQSVANIVNGFIACQPKHPFLQLAIDSLQEFAGRDFGDPIHATGPFFLDEVLKRYQKVATSEAKTVTVVPPQYFLPTYDESESDTISTKCYPDSLRRLPPKGQVVCRELLKRSFHNIRTSQPYTDHYWVHAYMHDDDWKMSNVGNIFYMVPGVTAAKTNS